ncbi:TonB-dependent receptor [Flavobacterium sp.]|uniref:TonB-dependent receptor n=1 Tax=Flavobacterium sp. TaxID=239 RepID=UPI003D0DF351
MKQKLHFLLLLSLFYYGTSSAQYRIFGNIRNAKDENVFSVKVILTTADENNYIHQVYTDKSGNFSLKTKEKTGKLILKAPGYQTLYKFVEITNNKLDVGILYLEEDLLKNLESESALVDLAFHRKSPTATNTILENNEFNHNSNKDFIERTNLLPGVYANPMGGSYAQSQMRMRGYNENNITPLLDGISLRDFESGEVNWSFIAPASDALDAIQIQRGLGSSKIVNSSVAGTVNLLLRDPFAKYDNYFSAETGNNDYKKYSLSLNSGNTDKGFGINFTLSNTSGNGYFSGTDFNAIGYYLGLGYKTQKHKFTLKVLGAPTWNNLRNKISSINDILQADNSIDTRYNHAYNTYNGQSISLNSNANHTPFSSFEWQYAINKNNTLAVKGYGIYGYNAFKDSSGAEIYSGVSSFTNTDNNVDFDRIRLYNTAALVNTIKLLDGSLIPSFLRETYTVDGKKLFLNSTEWDTKTSGVSLVETVSQKKVYGGLLNYASNLTSKLKLDVGLDARKSVSRNTKYLNNLLGADGYLIDQLQNKTQFTTETFSLKDNLFNVFKPIDAQKIDFDKENISLYYGAFAQVQLNLKKINFLLQGGYSQNDFSKRMIDVLDQGISEESEHVRLDSYNVKFGANWNMTAKSNIWFNTGLVSRVPIANYVFDFYTNNINAGFKNEDFKAVEMGYTFLSKKFNLNLIAYGNFLSNSTEQLFETGYGITGFTHQLSKRNTGVELDFTYKPFNRLTFYSSHSYAQWLYTKDGKYTEYENNQTTDLYIKDTNIGGAPQWMSSLAIMVEPFKNLTFNVSGKYHDNFYSNTPAEQFDPIWYPNSFAKSDLKLPSFVLFDAALKYKIKLLNEHLVNIGFAMNNVFDTVYINESTRSFNNNQFVPNSNMNYESQYGSSFKNVNNANTAFFGPGRTWNFAVQYRF